ncbi:Sulfatase [Sphingopyxis sp. YR583]|uniref:sulfatase-like hydrolase/transferase n=1 Tax=Sphingopyxis sp. YR583 TaxID=1881047 RepID=UPI0008A7F868|nr:sulfatase-like hydrolase/transferase [Sphingopyxis sp. YR583]SEH14089.1 Sulfatase [Sphingopyxis sp. YR583]
MLYMNAIKPLASRAFAPAGGVGLAAFLNWALCWIILPNLPFLPITVMGGPMRASEIMLCGAVGFAASWFGYWVRLTAFFGLLFYLTLVFIANMFNMHISMILSVIALVLDLRPAASPEYMVGGGLLILVLAFAARQLRKPQTLHGLQWIIAAAALTYTLAQADYIWARDGSTAYNRMAPVGAPFTSATRQTGFLTLADGKRNVMIVVVEAMGLPTEATLRERLDAIWTRPELSERFAISQGSTTFYNSTTKGEIRELCQRWGDYGEITGPQPDCLPAILARRGYRTHAFHGFSPKFFDRDQWYPLIGFEQTSFRDTIEAEGAGHCPNVFPGACDRDIPRLIGRDLAAAKEPQFIYWLTLNSHLPVVANAELRTENCRQLGAVLDSDYPQVCRLFAVWDDTAAALAAMASRPDFPPTDILIVGDHMPPFTQQKSRLMFDSAKVPWVLLRYRPSRAAT